MVDITERFLMDTGGWQAMKHAKALVEMGRVISAHYGPPVLKGIVRDGETEYRAGLKIQSYSDVENICSCRASRDWGTICAHSLALGLTLVRQKAAPKEQTPAQRTPSAPARPTLKTDGDDPLIEVHLVLPPSWLTGWERGQIMIGFEVVMAGKRLLASALEANGVYRCSAQDLTILEFGRGLIGGQLPGMISLSGDSFLDLLQQAAGHPRISSGRKTAIDVSSTPVRPRVVVEVLADSRWKIAVPFDEKVGKLIVGTKAAWLWQEPSFCPVAPGLPQAYFSLLKEPVVLSAEQGLAFQQRELPGLHRFFETDSPRIDPGLPEIIATFEGSLNYLSAKLQCLYGQRLITLGVTSPSEEFVYQTEQGPRCRNHSMERRSVEDLRTAGFQGPDAKGDFVLKGQNSILNFFAHSLPSFQKRWKTSIGSRFRNITNEIEKIEPRIDVISSGENWFEFSFSLESSGGDRFSAFEVQRLLQMGQNFTKVKGDKLAVFDPAGLAEFESVLRDCDPEQLRPGLYRIPRRQASYLDSAFRDLSGALVRGSSEWSKWTSEQQQLTPLNPIPLGDLESTLRDYQKQGVYWMHFLGQNALGGILADEMGLGKTLQTLAFLRSVKGPSLVVCPASLIFNWRREAERFAPDLRILLLEGPNRKSLFDQIPEHDLIITSYPLLRRDVQLYRSRSFKAVILDEANHIKNPETQNAQAAMTLRADHRFVLTGTPVENSVRDLWSIANFVLPGYLGSREDFRERYELPIARGSEPERSRLAKRLRPIMLRRRKRDVARELPEKIVQVSFCDLSEDQKELYGKLHAEGRKKLEDLLATKDQGRARMAVLTTLLRLRQVCCDLRLLDQQPKADAPRGQALRSGKMELFLELVEEAIDGDHRVLVFSQFVAMLKLIRAELEKFDIPFCYLDGQTKDRAAEVDRFQKSDAVPLFLISLKAGGVGLNLSGADTVFHFDPWWNPAVEDQATDRAHRIGQHRTVTSYKLIARGTIEEKILQLQQKKRDIIDATVESEEPVMQGLSTEELAALLSEEGF